MKKILKKISCSLFGHKYGSREWGIDLSEGTIDLWCYRCNNLKSGTIDQLKNELGQDYYEARSMIYKYFQIDTNKINGISALFIVDENGRRIDP